MSDELTTKNEVAVLNDTYKTVRGYVIKAKVQVTQAVNSAMVMAY